MEITIKIKNEEKAKSFRNLENISGIWKGRDISTTILRKKAWREDAAL